MIPPDIVRVYLTHIIYLYTLSNNQFTLKKIISVSRREIILSVGKFKKFQNSKNSLKLNISKMLISNTVRKIINNISMMFIEHDFNIFNC